MLAILITSKASVVTLTPTRLGKRKQSTTVRAGVVDAPPLVVGDLVTAQRGKQARHAATVQIQVLNWVGPVIALLSTEGSAVKAPTPIIRELLSALLHHIAQ